MKHSSIHRFLEYTTVAILRFFPKLRELVHQLRSRLQDILVRHQFFAKLQFQKWRHSVNALQSCTIVKCKYYSILYVCKIYRYVDNYSNALYTTVQGSPMQTMLFHLFLTFLAMVLGTFLLYFSDLTFPRFQKLVCLYLIKNCICIRGHS